MILKIIHYLVCRIFAKRKSILFYLAWTTDLSKLQIIAFSPISTFQVRLPAGNALNLIIHIRDTLDCIAEFNLSSVSVLPDLLTMSEFIHNNNKSLNEMKNNPIIQLLASGNQNTVGQIMTSISQEFDKVNNQTTEKAISSKVCCFL